ncbi:uridine kinase family protein [Pseudokineococcus sp. 1T1Z-3]|uniref:uridine kinase family protein n=1 Tax=Pseudokineococcus sp. 1T1Z-3 TaxID=3132745 RepID=UPI0030A09B29
MSPADGLPRHARPPRPEDLAVDGRQDALFAEPAGARRPPARRVVLLTGPSGSGKTSLVRRLGLPVLALDDFYRDGDEPGLPRRFGIVDWDDPGSWDAARAVAALERLCREGECDVPVYDIPTSRRTGAVHLSVGTAPVVVAEGIFAADLVAACRERALLADAVCLQRPAAVTFTFRLLRDLAEARKPPHVLVRRGLALTRAEPGLRRRWTDLGCRPLSPADAEAAVRALL